MENLAGTKLLRNKTFESAKEFLAAKEFTVLFYGGNWDKKSCAIVQKLNSLVTTINQIEDDFARSFIEVLYVSNDKDSDDFENVTNDQMNRWIYALPWNDERVVQLKNTYKLNSAPLVLVFDRNYECVTREGADDLLKMNPLACRNYWIDLLMDQKQIYRRGMGRTSDDDD